MTVQEQGLKYFDSLRKENLTLKNSQEILKPIEENLAMAECLDSLKKENLTLKKENLTLKKENLTLKKSQEILKSIEENLAMTEGKLLDAENKLKDMEEARACKICMDHYVCIAFVPCGHLVTCMECASKCLNCPMCRKPIQSQIKTFMS